MMILIGIPFAGGGIFVLRLGWKAQQKSTQAMQWPTVHAVLLEVRLDSERIKDSQTQTYEVNARYSYEIDGQSYESQRVSFHEGADNIGSWHLDRYATLKAALDADGAFKAYVNPANPADAVLFPELRVSMLLFHGIFGGVFALVGAVVLIAGLVSIFGGGRARKLERQFPAEPWKWREDWASGVVKSDNRKTAVGLVVFAVFWIGISTIVLISMIASGGSPPVMAWLVILLFEAIGIGMLVWAIRELRVAKRYGAAELHLASVPGVIGGKLAGVVTLPDYAEPYEEYRVELVCERTVRRGKSTTRVKEWSAELKLDPKKLPAKRDGVQIPILFGIPYGLPPSEYPITWTLRVRGKQPGIDVDVRFRVPVFETAESRPDFQLDDSGIRPYFLS